jgi:hypothetical protein
MAAAVACGTALFRLRMELLLAVMPGVAVFALAFAQRTVLRKAVLRGSGRPVLAAICLGAVYPLGKEMLVAPAPVPAPAAREARLLQPLTGRRDVILSDDAAATAWHSGRPTVLLPVTERSVPEIMRRFGSVRWLLLTDEARKLAPGWHAIYGGFARGIAERERLRRARRPYPEGVRLSARGTPLLDALDGSAWVPLEERPSLDVIVAAVPGEDGARRASARLQ